MQYDDTSHYMPIDSESHMPLTKHMGDYN